MTLAEILFILNLVLVMWLLSIVIHVADDVNFIKEHLKYLNLMRMNADFALGCGGQ